MWSSMAEYAVSLRVVAREWWRGDSGGDSGGISRCLSLWRRIQLKQKLNE